MGNFGVVITNKSKQKELIEEKAFSKRTLVQNLHPKFFLKKFAIK